MDAKKFLSVIIPTVIVAILSILLYMFWPAITGTIKGKSYHTAEDVQSAYDKGFNDGNKSKAESDAKIAYYEEIVDDYTKAITMLNDQVSDLNAKNNGYLSQIEMLEQTKKANLETIKNLNEVNKNNEDTITNLNTQIVSLTGTISNDEATIQRLNETIASNNALIKEKENRIKELEGNIDSNEIEIAKQKNQIIELTKENNAKQAEIDTLNSTTTSLNNQITNLNSLIEELESANTKNISTINTLNSKLELQKSQILQLQAELTNNNSSMMNLNSKIAELEQSVKYYENYIIELENKDHFVAIFEYNGSVFAIREADENGKVSITPPANTEYLEFNYWKVNEDGIDLDTFVLTSNTKIVADITYRYKVQFIVDGEEYSSELVKWSNPPEIPADPIKDKYTFIGWSIDGVNIVDLASYEVAETTTFVALFKNNYGLFNTDTGVTIYTWEDLIELNFLEIENGVLKAGANVKRLSGDLKIENTISSIDDRLFENCSALVNVYIPEGVTKLGASSFSSCLSLKYVEIPKSCITFGNSVFNTAQYASNLKQVNYLGSLSDWLNIDFESERSNPLYYTHKLTLNGELLDYDITIPNDITVLKPYSLVGISNTINLNKVTELGKCCFYKSEFPTINIPASVTTIGARAFYQSKIQNITMPETITELPDFAFCDCTELKIFDFSHISKLGSGCFNGSGLEEIKLSVDNMVINSQCFKNCKNLKTFIYDIPTTVTGFSSTTSGLVMYSGVTEGMDLIITDNVQKLPSHLLYSCSLKSVTIGKNVNYAVSSAIYYSSKKLEVINFNAVDLKLSSDNMASGDSNMGLFGSAIGNSGNPNGTILNIGSYVERLNNNLFYNFASLTEVNYIGIPSVKYIGMHTFSNTPKLKYFFIPKSVEIIKGANDKSPWYYYLGGINTVLYCELDSAPSTFEEGWNYVGKTICENIKYGYSYEDYLNELELIKAEAVS